MKSLAWICVLLIGIATARGAEPVAPSLALRINGRGTSATALELWRGEPVIAEVLFRNSDRSAKEAIVLTPPTGPWASRVNIRVTDSAGAPAKWSFVATGKQSAAGLTVQPNTISRLVLRMEPGDSTALVKGRYVIVARLELADGRGWRGTAQSEQTNVEVIDAPAQPKDAMLGRRQLLRVNDALLAGDVARAEAAMKEMLAADIHRPEGFVAMGLIFEARGERELALAAIDLAITRAAGDARKPQIRPATRAGAPAPAPQVQESSVPLEYFDLRHRFELMPIREASPK